MNCRHMDPSARTVENHGNTEITETTLFIKCHDFAKRDVFLVKMPWFCIFYQIFFVFNQQVEVYRVIVTQNYLLLPVLTNSVCLIVTFWLNIWALCHGINMYFNAPQWQHFTNETLPLHVLMVVNVNVDFIDFEPVIWCCVFAVILSIFTKVCHFLNHFWPWFSTVPTYQPSPTRCYIRQKVVPHSWCWRIEDKLTDIRYAAEENGKTTSPWSVDCYYMHINNKKVVQQTSEGEWTGPDVPGCLSWHQPRQAQTQLSSLDQSSWTACTSLAACPESRSRCALSASGPSPLYNNQTTFCFYRLYLSFW